MARRLVATPVNRALSTSLRSVPIFTALLLGLAGVAIPPVSAASAPVATVKAVRTAATYPYGADERQALDFYPTTTPGEQPLIVFIHGGAWQFGDRGLSRRTGKAKHFPEEGYHLASVGYRLVPDVTVEQQAADLASAIRFLIDRADALDIDTRRIVLMGHSAGAHLAALVATDPRYLASVKMKPSDIAGVIGLDGAAYDAGKVDGGLLGLFLYSGPFGNDAARRAALSPVYHAETPNAGSFLLLHVRRPDSIAQANALEQALSAAGTEVARQQFEGSGLSGHLEINNRMGDPAYAATSAVDEWLAALFAR